MKIGLIDPLPPPPPPSSPKSRSSSIQANSTHARTMPPNVFPSLLCSGSSSSSSLTVASSYSILNYSSLPPLLLSICKQLREKNRIDLVKSYLLFFSPSSFFFCFQKVFFLLLHQNIYWMMILKAIRHSGRLGGIYIHGIALYHALTIVAAVAASIPHLCRRRRRRRISILHRSPCPTRSSSSKQQMVSVKKKTCSPFPPCLFPAIRYQRWTQRWTTLFFYFQARRTSYLYYICCCD